MFETVLGLDPVGAGVVDVLEGLAHPVGARGLEPLPLQAALGLKLEFGQARLVFEPQVLRPFQQAVLPAPGLPGLVDGLVGVLDHMELVDDLGGVGKPLADALANPRLMSHVTGRTRLGSPLWSMKSLANRSMVCASLSGVTLITLRSTKSATTVMQLCPRRLVSSMPIASTPAWSSYRRASRT